MTIGKRIKERRKELKISADELAKKLGKDRSTIYRYEKGDIENLPLDILEPIASALDTSPQYLMGWEKTEEKQHKEFSADVKDGDRTLGDVIKFLREDSKMSLVEFSEEIGLPLNDLQQYENGRKQLSANTINAVAQFYGLTPEDITSMLMYTVPDDKPEIRLSPTYLAYAKKWNVEFGGKISKEDYEKLFEIARFLIWQREN